MGAIGGIAGNVDQNALRKMSESVKHRGRDEISMADSGVIFFTRCTDDEVCCRCLDDGNRLISFTGELYDFERSSESSLNQSIAEALASVTDGKLAGLNSFINGVYAFVIYDVEKRVISLGRDPAGFCPLYYIICDDRVIFGSEIRSILTGLDERVELDTDVLGRFLAFGHCPGVRTLFRGIKRVPPSSVLNIYMEDLSTELFIYSPPDHISCQHHEKDICRSIYETVKDAVARYTRIGGSPYGIFLSGGVDSSFLTAMLHEVVDEDIVAYTAVFSDREYNQSLARLVTESLEVEHKLVLIRPEDVLPVAEKAAFVFDDLIANVGTLVPGFLLTEKASEKAKSIFTSDYADVLFGGSKSIKSARIIDLMTKVPGSIRFSSKTVLRRVDRFLKNYIPQIDHTRPIEYYKWYKGLVDASLSKEANRPIQSVLEGFFGAYFDSQEIPHLVDEVSDTSLIAIQDEIRRYFKVPHGDTFSQMKTALKPILHTDDNGPLFNEKLSGYFAIPFRSPIMTDIKLHRLARNIPWELKIPSLNPNHSKYLWRKTIRLYTPLPSKVVAAKKKGMSANPITEWLCRELMDEVTSLVLDSLSELPINTDYIAKRLRKGIGLEIRALLMLSFWYKHHQRFLV